MSQVCQVKEKGWASFSDLFSDLADLKWLVLRNEQYLPYNFWGNDKDLDVLCDDVELFVKKSRAKKRGRGISAYYIIVDSKKVDLDLRFVGDGYFDADWQKECLNSRVINQDNIPIMSRRMKYFTLIYHVFLQKKKPTKKYDDFFSNYESCFFFNQSPVDRIFDANDRVNELASFMKEQDYLLIYPADTFLCEQYNKAVFKQIVSMMVKNKRMTLFTRLKIRFTKLMRLFPSGIKQKIVEYYYN